MKYFEFKKELTEERIKILKNSLRIERCMLFSLFFLTALNGYVLYENPSKWFNGIVVGGLLTSFFWSAASVSQIKLDLKLAKQMLNFYEQLEDKYTDDNTKKLYKVEKF